MSGSAETHALPHASGDAGYIAESNAQHSYHVRSNAGHQGVPTLVSGLAMGPFAFRNCRSGSAMSLPVLAAVALYIACYPHGAQALKDVLLICVVLHNAWLHTGPGNQDRFP